MKTAFGVACVIAIFAAGQSADATLGYSEGFENPSFTPGGTNWNNNGGTITRATSGTGGITSSTGVAHGVLSGAGPYTQFGGYSSSFAGGFVASVDIYIDPSSIASSGWFDYSVAASNQLGGHLRDFIFHVGNVGGAVKVNASNVGSGNEGASDFKINTENGGANYTFGSAGWYTFQQVFYDNAGTLAVDMNVLDDSDSLLYSVTRSNAGDLISSVVGGNRYGWFVGGAISGLAIDNSSLSSLAPIPEPTAALFGALLTTGLGATIARRRRDEEVV